MDTGLSQRTLNFITSTMQKYSGVEKAILFGSRAKGTFREGSDIDLCLKTDSSFSHEDLLHIMRDFEESSVPYNSDILVYSRLKNEDLVQHINQCGICLYEKGIVYGK